MTAPEDRTRHRVPLRRETAQVLRIPADPAERCTVQALTLSGVVLSDALGGGLLDDAIYATVDEQGYVVYLDLDRGPRDLPVNSRAVELLSWLGCAGAAEEVGLRGDVLVLGADADGDDTHVPTAVLSRARRAGLLPRE
jgi:hypothetical protein